MFGLSSPKTPTSGYTEFGDGEIKLSKYNIVYFALDGSGIAKAVRFCEFKRHIHYYSEFMRVPCCRILYQIEEKALENAKKNKVARDNLVRK